MAATVDVYPSIAAMQAVTPANGTAAVVIVGAKATPYVYLTAGAAGVPPAVAGWFKVGNP